MAARSWTQETEPVAAGVLLDVLEVGPDLALGRAAAGGEDADDAVRLLVAELEQRRRSAAPLNRRDRFRLTMHSPRPGDEVASLRRS